MDEKKEVKEKEDMAQVKLFLIPQDKDYNEIIITKLSKLNGTICYVTTNKTFDALKEIFAQSKYLPDEIVFIDAISKTLKKTPDYTEDSYFVSSPGALTELSLSIDKFLSHDFDYLIFDSLTTLEIYQSSQIIAKFLKDLITKIKKTKTKAILYALDSKSDEMVKYASPIVDKIIRINNK